MGIIVCMCILSEIYVYSVNFSTFTVISFQQYGVKVVAIDLSANMINIGMERAQEAGISEEVIPKNKNHKTRELGKH